jgi:hypothetical protein
MPACRSRIAYQLRTHNNFAGSASKYRCSNRSAHTVSRVRPIALVGRRAAVVAMCLVMLLTMAPVTAADPEAGPVAAATAPNDGLLPSNPPATLRTPDGWTLGLGAKDESQVPVAPLTTAVSSRNTSRAEYSSVR